VEIRILELVLQISPRHSLNDTFVRQSFEVAIIFRLNLCCFKLDAIDFLLVVKVGLRVV